MKKLLIIIALVVGASTIPVIETGCAHNQVTLAPGGVYTDPVIAESDQAILDANKVLVDFVGWYTANSAFLAQWPQIGNLAADVTAHRKEWIKNAYAAEDSYSYAATAYRTGRGSQVDADERHQQLNGALSVLNNITAQIIAFKSAHPHA